MKIQKIIDYIDSRIDQQLYEGSWINDEGERITTDVGYGAEWWENCMKPELLRKFGGKQNG